MDNDIIKQFIIFTPIVYYFHDTDKCKAGL